MNQTTNARIQFSVWPLLLVLLVWTGIVWLSVASYRPVPVQPASVASSKFSAARAESILATLVGDAIPHPSGSQQNERVRERVVEYFESFGYSVESQTGQGKVSPRMQRRSKGLAEVPLTNVIARWPVTDRSADQRLDSAPILLVAHYDSVFEGPGAGDDGIGVAALIEIARMLGEEDGPIALAPSGTAPQREVAFLITDGEELGMLGAQLFCDQHPLAQEVGVVINVEARGTSGPSLMFETSRQSRLLVPVFARSGTRLFTSSLFYEVYQRLPNDTDFSIFRRAGMLGYNFAIIGDVKNYHTPADNFETVDRGSLQHHGENVLSLVRGLRKSKELDQLLTEGADQQDLQGRWLRNEVVYFDLFGRVLVWWPVAASLWISSIVGMVMLLIFGNQIRIDWRSDGTLLKGPSANRSWLLNLVAFLLNIALVIIGGYFIQSAVGTSSRLAHPWPQSPVPILLGYWSASFAIVAGIATGFGSRLDARKSLIITIAVWWMLAMASSWILPGASFLFVVPVTCVAIALVAFRGQQLRNPVAAIIVFAIAVGVVWLPLERLFYDAVGFRMPIVMLIRIAMVCSPLFCVLTWAGERTTFRFSLLMAATTVLAFFIATWTNADV